VSKRFIRIYSQICQKGEGWKKILNYLEEKNPGGNYKKMDNLKLPESSSLFKICVSFVLRNALTSIWCFNKRFHEKENLQNNIDSLVELHCKRFQANPLAYILHSAFPYTKSIPLSEVIDIIPRLHTLQPCALELVCGGGESMLVIFPTPEVYKSLIVI
jgi:hypothetical protein